MQSITITQVEQAQVDERTQKLRYSHPDTCSWYPTTQAWAWEGGDALVVVTGSSFRCYSQCYIVMRLGDELHVVPAGGVAPALRAFGFDPAIN